LRLHSATILEEKSKGERVKNGSDGSGDSAASK
jgi:hypothetical protein